MKTKAFLNPIFIEFRLILIGVLLSIVLFSAHIENTAFAEIENSTVSAEYDMSQYEEFATVGYNPQHPSSGTIGADSGAVSDRHLIPIPEANYFRNAPKHGTNSSGTCGPVAAQLLLSYNNYYNDRRIIGNNLLFGANTTTGKELNPNFSTDPTSMTSSTLGSTESYLNHIVNNYISGGGTIIGVKNGIEDLLDDRNGQIAGTINYTADYHHALGIFKISTSGPKSELNAGRPVILGMYHTLGGIDHFVVAYGYQYLNGDFGYIVHYGWNEGGDIYAGTADDHTFSWINADWVNSYAKLEINHTHTYNVHTDGTHRELRCTVCQHRTTAYKISSISTNTITITGVKDNTTLSDNIALPQTIWGRTVTQVGDYAFLDESGITSVTIPNTVTSIGESAFELCSSLSQVSIPSSVTAIGSYAFAGCAGLASVTVPTGVTSIGTNAFPANSKIVLAGGRTAIQANLLRYQAYACKVYIPATVTSIGANAFHLNTHVFLSDGRTTVQAGLFQNQTGLKKISISPTVVSVGNDAFYGCTSLEYVSFDEYLVNMPGHSVSYNNYYYSEESLNVNLVAGVTYKLKFNYSNLTSSTANLSDVFTNLGVGETTFAVDITPADHFPNGASGTQTIEFTPTAADLSSSSRLWVRFIRTGTEQSVSATISGVSLRAESMLQTIGNSAFRNCSELYEFIGWDEAMYVPPNFPKYTAAIGDYAFSGCSRLSHFTPGASPIGAVGAYAFENCGLTLVMLNDSLQTIGTGAFSGNTELSNIEIPIGVTTMGASVFVGNTSLHSIKVRAESKPGGWDTNWNSGGISVTWGYTPSCVAEGPFITLADGSEVLVEDLTGAEMLLVWNMLTGSFDYAPILFVDSHAATEYEIIELAFSDGTEVKVIDEHGFFDFNLNEYVFIRNDAAQYIGHYFNKKAYDGFGNMIWTAVELISVDIYTEYTVAYSPVTFSHLNYYNQSVYI